MSCKKITPADRQKPSDSAREGLKDVAKFAEKGFKAVSSAQKELDSVDYPVPKWLDKGISSVRAGESLVSSTTDFISATKTNDFSRFADTASKAVSVGGAIVGVALVVTGPVSVPETTCSGETTTTTASTAGAETTGWKDSPATTF